jgi:hypothetical protein
MEKWMERADSLTLCAADQWMDIMSALSPAAAMSK